MTPEKQAENNLRARHPNFDKALATVDTILKNLAESDFAYAHGVDAVKSLRDFRLDMATDIAKGMS